MLSTEKSRFQKGIANLVGGDTCSCSQWTSGVRRIFSWGSFIQWQNVVICIWCALFVTSQFDVIFMFPKQRFGEV